MKPLETRQSAETGQPLITSTTIVCDIDTHLARTILLTDIYYNKWVIPGLNALNEKLHNPMAVYDRIETTNNGEELYLYFDLRSPFRINDIMIPFIFTVFSNDENETSVELRLKQRIIAVKQVILNILIQSDEERTILSAELTIDFTFIVDLLLNKKLYSENTENRLRLCIEHFLRLIAAQEVNTSPLQDRQQDSS
ncbi:MAG: hypothetical protein KAQ69_00095 [Spirochaetales bacterium]|nr:hypothetical protein [Spirochaetales bacterium]